MFQQALLSWGNLQYEESQLVAVAGGDWRAILDAATAHFREAGCNETDIRGARRCCSLDTHQTLFGILSMSSHSLHILTVLTAPRQWIPSSQKF